VRDQQRREAQRDPVDDEHREQGGADHDLGRRHRQDDQEVGRAPAEELVADEGERHQGADHGRDQGRQRRELEREQHRVVELGDRERVLPVVEGEAAVEREVEPVARRLPEREDGDHGDRDQHVRDRDTRVDHQPVSPQPGHRQRAAASSSSPMNASVPAARI
jgi:hypothetical protein